jgi:uncharacterized membrane protein YfcA
MDYNLIIIILVISGFGSGLIIGIGSGTCGIILLPVFTLFIGRSIHEAIGSNLFVDTIVGAVAGTVFFRKGNVDIKSVSILGLCGVIGAVIGSQFTSNAPETSLMFIVGLIIILLGINFIWFGIRKNVDFIHSKISFKKFQNNKIASFILLGLVIGFISGFMGIGGGGFIAIILILIFGYEIHTAIGTSLIMMSCIGAAGGIGHLLQNQFFIDAILYSGIAAGFGALTGSYYANKIDEDKLGRVVGLVIIIMGIAIIFRIIFS